MCMCVSLKYKIYKNKLRERGKYKFIFKKEKKIFLFLLSQMIYRIFSTNARSVFLVYGTNLNITRNTALPAENKLKYDKCNTRSAISSI